MAELALTPSSARQTAPRLPCPPVLSESKGFVPGFLDLIIYHDGPMKSCWAPKIRDTHPSKQMRAPKKTDFDRDWILVFHSHNLGGFRVCVQGMVDIFYC